MITGFMAFVQSLMGRLEIRSESGQALVEYGLILGLIAVVCVAALTLLGTNVSSMLNSIAGSV
jgi:pilus assembly protein Flp/PilA